MNPDKIVARIPSVAQVIGFVEDDHIREKLLSEGFSEEEVFLVIRGAEAYLKVSSDQVG